MAKKKMRWGRALSMQSSETVPGGAGIVAFDFDGTITVEDSFTRFLRWRTSPGRHAQGMVRLIPSALAYLGHRNRGRIKAAAVKEFLAGASREALEAEARAFAEAEAVRLMRPDALRSWRWWRGRGAKLVIVTASPGVVVAPFARGLGADALIATELAYDDAGRVTGGFDGANCRGPEKVRRLQAMFGPDVRLRAAYGDTGGDREMLQIADHAGYREFKERP
jgi:phosphatidylglycerophosphatase C